MKYIYCLICRKETLYKKIFGVLHSHKGKIKTKKFTYYQCESCSFWIIVPRPNKSDFAQIYKKNYYPDLEAPVKNPLIDKIYKLKITSSYEELVTKNTNGVNKQLLDIGCGTGAFLERMSKKGYIPFGVDPFKDAIILTSKKIGKKNVIHGYISKLKTLRKKFDVVTMWHVLEHTLDPVNDLRIIRRVLKKNGKLIFEVPNADSYIMRIFKEYYSWNMIPEHHIYFSPKSTKEALLKSGYIIEKMYTPPKALLNFSNSFNNYLNIKIKSSVLIKFLYTASIPISILIVIISSILNKGEVLRVVAHK